MTSPSSAQGGAQDAFARVRGVPVLGSLPFIVRDGMLATVLAAWRSQGDWFRLSVPGMDLWLVAHPEGAEHVLKTKRSNYVKGRAYDGFRAIAGDGSLTSEGEAWRRKRRRVQPAFTRGALEPLTQVMGSIVEQTVGRWRELAARDPVIDSSAEMTRMTLRVVGRALFGLELGDAASASSNAFGQALHFASVSGQGLRLPAWVPTRRNRQMSAAMAQLDATVAEIIASARARVARGEPPNDLLSQLVTPDPELDTLTDRELRDEVITLFLAGHETSALALSWCLDFVARDPSLQEDLIDERDRVVGGRTTTLDDCDRLPLHRAVIDETLRIRPPIWALARNVVEADAIGGHPVPVGANVVPVVYCIHRHPDFWPDPERFVARRFLDSGPTHEYAYLPFSRGPRMCVGAAFALAELQIGLSTLLSAFRLSAVDDEPPAPRARVTLAPARPLRLRLHAR